MSASGSMSKKNENMFARKLAHERPWQHSPQRPDGGNGPNARRLTNARARCGLSARRNKPTHAAAGGASGSSCRRQTGPLAGDRGHAIPLTRTSRRNIRVSPQRHGRQTGGAGGPGRSRAVSANGDGDRGRCARPGASRGHERATP